MVARPTTTTTCRVAGEVDALLEAARLKAVARAGWLRRGLADVESVAAHSWGVAWLVTALLPDGLDLGRALSYAVLHDLAEVRVGDLTPHDGVAADDKARREDAAMRALVDGVAWGPRMLATWRAYEAQADAEARFVRELDRLDMAIQAVVYAEASGRDLTEFLDSAGQVIAHPRLVPILAALRTRSGRSASRV